MLTKLNRSNNNNDNSLTNNNVKQALRYSILNPLKGRLN